MDSVLQDLRYTLRTLKRDAAFAGLAIAIVGAGIAGSSTVFSLLNTVLLRPLPFKDPSHLAWIPNGGKSGLSGQTIQVGHFLDLRKQSQSFSDIAAYFAFYGVGDFQLIGQGEPERLSAVPVTENFFPLLGVQPEIGRQFSSEESSGAGPKAVMLSHGLWARRFARDRSVVGRTLNFGDALYTVVGVLPESFDFGSVFSPGAHIDLFTPFPLTEQTNRWGNTLAGIGRLKPGVSVGAAAAEIAVLSDQIAKAHRERNGLDAKVSRLSDHVSGRFRAAFYVLAGAVGVVMLIVCANLSNLLLARTAARHKEIAVRVALGAGRGRLIRQMLTESLVLSCSGALLGLVLAVGLTRLLARLDAFNIPLLANVRVDGGVLGFTALAAILAGLVFGLAPAFQGGSFSLHDSLKESSRGSSDSKRSVWLRGTLVVSEIVFACVLLVGAGLLIRSFLRVLEVDPGFRPENAATVRIDPSRQYNTPALQLGYFNEALRLVRSIPGVTAAGISDNLPLGTNRTWGAGAKGVNYPRSQYPLAFVRVVSDGYFTALGIPLESGRDFTAQDIPDSTPVVVINQSLARALWPGKDAVGRVMRACGERTVVGVVADVKHLALEQASGNEMYLPIRQCRDWSSINLVVRSTLNMTDLISGVRHALQPIAPDVPAASFRRMQDIVDKSVSPRRFIVLVLGAFAGFALLLASLGIYGVISYSVTRQTSEIGIRMALGARGGAVAWTILREVLCLAGAGLAISVPVALAGSRLIESFLFGVKGRDPGALAAAAAVLVGAAVVAGYVPARKASRIDPITALRHE
jgi:predicted permease